MQYDKPTPAGDYLLLDLWLRENGPLQASTIQRARCRMEKYATWDCNDRCADFKLKLELAVHHGGDNEFNG